MGPSPWRRPQDGFRQHAKLSPCSHRIAICNCGKGSGQALGPSTAGSLRHTPQHRPGSREDVQQGRPRHAATLPAFVGMPLGEVLPLLGAAAGMGAVRPLGHREATNTAKVQVAGRQVGARDAALQGAGGLIIQVCPHARVGAPTSCSAGVGARARRHWAKNTSRSSTSRGPLTGGGIQVHASWPLAAHRCARLRRPWVGRFSDPDPRQAAASGHATASRCRGMIGGVARTSIEVQ